MGASRSDVEFVEKVGQYLLSLPFDLKILQEAVTNPDLDPAVRELAAGTIIHVLSPQEGESPARYFDDIFFVRAALEKVASGDSEGAVEFRQRFSEVYDTLSNDIALFKENLGDLWTWLTGKLTTFAKVTYKGKKPVQCVDDEEVALFLYEEGLEFQTNYSVNEEQVKNKVRKAESILDMLQKKQTEDSKKKTA